MTKPAPKVSVVCAWYNRADYIRDTIDSILAQDFDDFEMVVVNDGSPDPRVRQLLDGYDDPRLRVIHQENRGFTPTIRRAIQESRGELIAVQGAGDISLPQRLGRQVAALEQDGAAVGSGTSHENIMIGGRTDGLRLVVDFPFDEVTRRELLQQIGSPLNHGDLMYRRSVYDRVGGYRPFFRFGQDFDLTLRMSRYGHFRICREVLYQRMVFFADGIASQVDRSLAQLKYAEIAKGCVAEVDRWGSDVVDIFGANAGLFLKPSGFIARAKAKTALKYLRMGHFEDGAYLAEVAMREKAVPLAVAARIMAWACRFPVSRKLVSQVVGMIPMKDRREFSLLVSRRIGNAE